MRILVVTQYFWPESFIINGLVSELKVRGHEVQVLTGLPNYPDGVLSRGYSLLKGPWKETYQGIQVHRSFLLPRGTGFVRLSFNYLSFVLGASLRGLFLKKDFDVIFCYAPSPITTCLPAIFLRWLTRKPLVFWVQDLWPESISAVGAIKSEKVIQFIGKLVRFVYSSCDLILVQSKAFKDSVVKWGGDANRIHYVPNWADPFLSTTSIPEWVQNLPKGFKIGFAGNIGKAQDLGTLVTAAELLKHDPEIKWIIAGDGSDKAWLDAEIKKRNLADVIYTVGKKPYSEMLPFFKSCDVLYVSLTNDYIFSLTIPSKVQAYMSAGKPIIAYLSGEGARIIEEAKVGLSAPSDSPQKLVDSILKMKAMPENERQEMGKSGLQYFNENFERSLIVSRITEMLSAAKFLN